VEADLPGVSAERGGGLHSVPQEQLLYRLSRDLWPAGGASYEDGDCERAGA